MEMYGTVWGAGWRAKNATPVPSKTPPCHLETWLSLQSIINLLTAKKYNAHSITDSSWTANSKSQVVSLRYNLTHSLSWGQRFGDAVKMRLDAHPEFQRAVEVLSSRWTDCRYQNKGNLKNGFFSAKGKCDLPLHIVWHSWKINK